MLSTGASSSSTSPSHFSSDTRPSHLTSVKNTGVALVRAASREKRAATVHSRATSRPRYPNCARLSYELTDWSVHKTMSSTTKPSKTDVVTGFRRSQLLDAARERFGKHGLAGTT